MPTVAVIFGWPAVTASIALALAGVATMRADKVVYDEDKEVMEVSGNVRLNLDTPGEQVR